MTSHNNDQDGKSMALQRDGFKSQLGFILAASGAAVGLGNLWAFPFKVSAGGGAAFVVVYLLFCFAICFPVLVAEIAIGRASQQSPVSAFKTLGFKRWAIFGYLGVLCGVVVLAFYNIIAAWAFGYFIELLMGNFAIGDQFDHFVRDWLKVGGYALIFMATTAYVVSSGIANGIEKVAKILMPLLLLMIIGLIAYGLTLPNAGQGLAFYLLPDFAKLSVSTVYSALGQAFFSLSLGMGALITLGSYLAKQKNIITNALWITATDILVALLAGLLVFPLLFSQGIEPTGGMGLLFKTLPPTFATLGPVLGVVVGAGFFLLLSFAALTSCIALLEVPTALLVDEYKLPRKTAAWSMAGFIFVLGIPSLLSKGAVDWFTHFIHLPGSGEMNFMRFSATLASDSFLPLGGMLICLFTSYRWQQDQFNHQLSIANHSMSGKLLQAYVNIALKYICPLVLAVMFSITILHTFFGIELIGGDNTH